MCVEVSWQPDGIGLHRQYIGAIAMSDVIKATMALHDHPRFDNLAYLIEDYRAATNAPFDARDLKQFTTFVQLRARTKPQLKVAIVSRSSAESTATANAFCSYMKRSHYRCRVFHDLADARAWAEEPGEG